MRYTRLVKQIYKTPQFNKWFAKLRDDRTIHAIHKRLKQVEVGHYGDYKSVGEGVFELRFHLNAGYRVYFTERAGEIVMLLAGGDKSSQSRDIKKAIELSKTV